MADVKTICVRLNLGKPIHKRAYELLQSQSDFSSNSQAIATALVDYFDNQERENRLVEKITSALSGFTSTVVPIVSEVQADDSLDDVLDFDFLGG